MNTSECNTGAQSEAHRFKMAIRRLIFVFAYKKNCDLSLNYYAGLLDPAQKLVSDLVWYLLKKQLDIPTSLRQAVLKACTQKMSHPSHAMSESCHGNGSHQVVGITRCTGHAYHKKDLIVSWATRDPALKSLGSTHGNIQSAKKATHRHDLFKLKPDNLQRKKRILFMMSFFFIL